jgi:NAD(P)-dependent dehydrogenase (short-subunit alcohol dehydrogenase family)
MLEAAAMDDPGSDPLNPVALITGAASGIGAALARRLAPRATGGLVLIDTNAAGLAAAADDLEGAPERVSTLAFDVSDPDRWRDTADFLAAQYGRLDWAVANAGIAHSAPIADMAFEEWKRVLQVNLDGVFLTLQTAMPIMRMNAQGGAIVVVASAAGLKPEPGIAAYGASKAAALQLARVAAKEGASDRIRVNAIAPGGVETPIWRAVPMFQDLVRQTGSEEAAFAQMAEMATPLGYFATADDIARQIELLLTDPAPITGATIVVDGGYTL